MHARIVRRDTTTQAISLPAGPGILAVICGLPGSRGAVVAHVVRPGPYTAGVDLWLGDAGGSHRPSNPAAQALAAFLSAGQLRQDFSGLALFTGGSDTRGRITPLTSDYDQIITTIASQLRPEAPGAAHGERAGDAPDPEVS